MVGFSGWTNSYFSLISLRTIGDSRWISKAEMSSRSRIVLLRLDDGVEVAAIGDVEDELAESGHIDVEAGLCEERRDVADPHSTTLPWLSRVSASTMPAGTSRRRRPSGFGRDQPLLDRTVTVPMVPWPHIGRQPLVSMKRIAASVSSRIGA